MKWREEKSESEVVPLISHFEKILKILQKSKESPKIKKNIKNSTKKQWVTTVGKSREWKWGCSSAGAAALLPLPTHAPHCSSCTIALAAKIALLQENVLLDCLHLLHLLHYCTVAKNCTSCTVAKIALLQILHLLHKLHYCRSCIVALLPLPTHAPHCSLH